MRRDGLSPKDFGLYVRSHPDSLLITAANKMRSGQEVTVEQSFSGRLRESYVVSTDPDVNARTFADRGALARRIRRAAGGVHRKGRHLQRRPVAGGRLPHPVRGPPTFAGQKSDVVSYLERIAEKRPLTDVLLISPGGLGRQRAVHPEESGARRRQRSADGTSWRLNKDRVASRGDEKLGLDDAQRKEAEALAGGEDGTGAVSDTHYRMVRNKPLLMIHSLEPRDGP
jgi:hypothetical protein